MIDDLITKDTLEPYRMFTSRAEYRILLRYSNTDERLFNVALKHNLLSNSEKTLFTERLNIKKQIRGALNVSIAPDLISHVTKIKQKKPVTDLLRRPECGIGDFAFLLQKIPELSTWPSWSTQELLFDVESEIKYEGYINRLRRHLKKQERSESFIIPDSVNYLSFKGLSNEAVEKLSFVRPETLGQASRVSGVTPADVSVLMVNLVK